MNEDLKQAWDAAYENQGEAIPVGDIVVCDDCSVDYTNRPDSGGSSSSRRRSARPERRDGGG